MSNRHRLLPDYYEFIKYEEKIANLLNHNVHKYKYIGKKGREYEVIQSVFTSTINSQDYQRLINRPIQNMDEERLVLYNNMEAFCNGFIP